MGSMSKIKKFWLITAAVLMAAGCVIFAVAMAYAGFEWSKLPTVSYVDNTIDLQEDFSAVSVSAGVSDVKFALWDEDFCRVLCCETDRVTHTATVIDGQLVIRMEDQRKWYDHVGIGNTEDYSITVYLPRKHLAYVNVDVTVGDVELPSGLDVERISVEGRSGDVICRASAEELEIRTTTGNVTMEGVTAQNIKLAVTTGDMRGNTLTSENITLHGEMGRLCLATVTCGTMTVEGTSLDTEMTDVTARVSLSVDTSTGDVDLQNCDAPSICLKATTGDVTARLLTGKRFIVNTRSGNVSVPENSDLGICEITTTTGDILVEISGRQ